MSELRGSHPSSAGYEGNREKAFTLCIADVMSLAAMPTFAVMAIAVGVLETSPMGVLCVDGHGSRLGGMALMYGLMSAFHLPVWLRLAAGHTL